MIIGVRQCLIFIRLALEGTVMRYHDEIEPLSDKCAGKLIPIKNKIIRMCALNQAITDIRKLLRMHRVSNNDYMADNPRLASNIKLYARPEIDSLG